MAEKIGMFDHFHMVPPTDIRQKVCILCPCPQLTAYWTPPPSCPRRICCCESSGKVPLLGGSIFRDAKTACIFLFAVLIPYFFIMDLIMLMRFRTVDVVQESKQASPDEMYSPFTHLTIKTIMNDPTSQYVIAPSAEYFDMFTKFSTIFSFITPNIISIAHLIIGFIAGKFVASENLYDRRVGVALFELRIWLDALDGVVYRAQSGTRLQFQSVYSTLGYYIDMFADSLGGVFLCFGLLFYLFKKFDHINSELPTFLVQDSAVKPGALTNGHSSASSETYSKKYIFLKVFFFGLCLACAGKFWDMAVHDFVDVFQTPMNDPKMSKLQFELCHSTTAIAIYYSWRILEAQALLQYILIPIIVDKVWEFLNYTQYILLIMIIGLYLVTLLFVNHVKTVLHQ